MARVTGNLELDGTTVKLNQGATTSQSIVAGTPTVASQVRLPNESDANTEFITAFSNNVPSKRVKFDTSASTASTTLTISTAQTTSQVLNIPNLTATDSLVLAASTQELSNKTFVDPVVKTGSDTLRLQTTTGNTAPGATIVLDPNNASRTVDLSGNLTLGANLTTNAHDVTINAASGGSTISLPATVNIGANLTTNSHALTLNAASGGSTVTLPSSVSLGANLTTNSNALTVNSATGGSTLTLPPTADFSGGNVSTSGTVTIGANFTTNSHALTLNAASGGSTVSVPASGTLLSMVSNVVTMPNTGNTTLNHATSAELTFGSNVSKVVVANDLEVQGTTTTINTTNLAVSDNNITVNNGGTKSSAAGAGLTVDSSGDSSPWTTAPALLYNDTLTSGWELRKGNGSASELMTAARTLVRDSFNYGAAATFNSSGGHSLVLQVSGNDRLRLESTTSQLQVSNNTVSTTDNTVALSGGSGTGNVTISTAAGASTGNITVDSTAAGGAGNISVAAKGTLTLQGTSLSVHSSTPVTVNNDTGNVVLHGGNSPAAALTIGTNNTQNVVIEANNNPRVTINHDSAAITMDIAGNRGIKIPVGTEAQRPSSPSAGIIRFNSDVSKFEGYNGTAWKPIGSGSGQGGINYIATPDAEDLVVDDPVPTSSGWVKYDDGPSATIPVDGTGGSSGLTFTTVNSGVIRGTKSFSLSNGGVNRRGQGVSYDFTIDPADTGRQLTISLDYRTTGTYDTGDIKLFIYDITNSTLLYPGVTDLPAYSTSGSAYNFKTSFVSTTSTSYRLILHVSTNEGTTFGITFDNVRVGPDQLLHSSPVTEWQNAGPLSITTTGTPPTKGTTSVDRMLYRRVGANAEFRIEYAQTTAGTHGTSGPYRFNLPAGLVIDTTKVTLGDTTLIGTAHLRDGSNYLEGTVYPITSSQVVLFISSSSSPLLNSVGPSFAGLGGAPVSYWAEFSVPIASWAGSTVSVDNSQVEYAYSTTAWGDSDDTNPANTGYGPQGAAFAAIDLSYIRVRRVKFLTPIQPTDDIDLQVSSDNGRSFVSVSKGVCFGLNNWVLPRFTYVDTGSGPDTHGIGVRIVDASAGIVEVILGRYFFRATDGSPVVYWSAEINANYRWRVVKSRNPLTIGGLTGTKWQTKYLASTVTSAPVDVSSLQFNNLEIGKTYRATAELYILQYASTDSRVKIDWTSDAGGYGTWYSQFRVGRPGPSWAANTPDSRYTHSFIFVATSTTLFTRFQTLEGVGIRAEASGRGTKITLEELPLHQQTSQWT